MIAILEHDRCALLHGDSAELGEILAPNTVDAVVTDPPAGISFMGKAWDEDKGGRNEWIAWLTNLMMPAFIALKPGGYALVWAIPRTSHWTATALEDCGFEIRDVHHHIFGTGFPKSLTSKSAEIPEGTGTAYKPAVEHWILCRKPLAGTVAANHRRFGTGVLNIDGCRIGDSKNVPSSASTVGNAVYGKGMGSLAAGTESSGFDPNVGRWPAHLSLEHTEACTLVGTRAEPAPEQSCPGGDACAHGQDGEISQTGGTKHPARDPSATRGEIVVGVYDCVDGCPVRLLDEQSGIKKDGVATNRNRDSSQLSSDAGWGMRKPTKDVGFGGGGGASRFFYVAKGSRAEKDEGLEHLAPKTGGEATGRAEGSAGTKNPRAGAGRTGGARNSHPTVKSVALMQWLVRLVTPPGGVVLDPFAGSGTTGVAALAEGLSFIGCEQGGENGEYLPILVGRLQHALEKSTATQ